MNVISLRGHQTRILSTGADGPACIFLHGFPEHAGAWEEVFSHLNGIRAFAPDQRGYGTSYRPEDVDAYSVRHLVDDLFALIGELNLDRVHLVGHDWGASVAYAAAFNNDPRIASLTVLNGAHPIPFQQALASGGAQTAASQYIPWLRREGSENVLAKNNFEKLAAFFAEGMDMSWLSGERLAEYRRQWRDEDTLRAMINWYRASALVVSLPGDPLAPSQMPNWDPENLRVSVPHLLIWGMADKALLPECTIGLEALCDDLRRVEIPGVDHWLHHQKPADIAKLIGEFVRASD